MCICGCRRLPGGARGGPGSSPFLTTYVLTPTSNARVYSRNSEESFLLRCLLRHCPRIFLCGHLINSPPLLSTRYGRAPRRAPQALCGVFPTYLSPHLSHPLPSQTARRRSTDRPAPRAGSRSGAQAFCDGSFGGSRQLPAPSRSRHVFHTYRAGHGTDHAASWRFADLGVSPRGFEVKAV